ncbi:MAG: hypothetical protein K0S74_26 [Chlamydiales bacterium]|jgi:hypothetical protein|nr:hypothetical protein [Chlamydiales bacterium]
MLKKLIFQRRVLAIAAITGFSISCSQTNHYPLEEAQSSVNNSVNETNRFPSVQSYRHKIWNQSQQKPQPIIIELLKLSHINPVQIQNYTDLVKITQDSWLRKAGTERWHIESKKELEDKRKEFIACFKKLGMLDEILPTNTNYDGQGILGATAKNVDRRAQFALKLLDNKHVNVPFTDMIEGERDLQLNEKEYLAKNFNAAADTINTEPQMMKYLGEHYFKDKKWTQIEASKGPGAIRANTEDTIVVLVKERFGEKVNQPQKIYTYNLISHQPLCYYQLFAAEVALKKHHFSHIKFDISGCITSNTFEEEIGLYLDTLARMIYCIDQYEKFS